MLTLLNIVSLDHKYVKYWKIVASEKLLHDWSSRAFSGETIKDIRSWHTTCFFIYMWVDVVILGEHLTDAL